jgi:2-polyprenyl-3-methyl-5-hydroxy-6-metoxy-1,4-benzoquinol methylase
MDYEKTYRKLYLDHGYMLRSDREELFEFCLPLLEKEKPSTVLDFGCGRGTFLDWIIQHSWCERAAGLDISDIQVPSSVPWTFCKCPTWCSPYSDKEFEWATSFDVLEHLTGSEILATLEEMRRVSGSGLIGMVYAGPDIYRCPLTGANLHRTVMDKNEWATILGHYGAIEVLDAPGKRTPFCLRWD